MERKLVLPTDFPEYAWEVAAKGVFWDAKVVVEGTPVPVTFYDPARLSQDVSEELTERVGFELRRTLVIPALTEDNMRRAVDRAPDEFFR